MLTRRISLLPPYPKKGQSQGIRANRRPNQGIACEIRQQMLYRPVLRLRLATLEVQGHRINSGAEAHFQLHSSTANLHVVAGHAVDAKAARQCVLQASVQASRLQIPLLLYWESSQQYSAILMLLFDNAVVHRFQYSKQNFLPPTVFHRGEKTILASST